jgi:hypothetical protein
MSWLLPGFLGASLAVALPVILHFLRSKPKTIVPFPTLRFLTEGAITDTRKHRLRRLLTLLLRCLIIGLLAAAFARPFFGHGQFKGGKVVVVAVDNSMSMQTRGRWEERQKWALDQLSQLGPEDRAGILLMQPSPTWLAPISPNVEQTRETLKAMLPGYESTHYMPALRMAGQALAMMAAQSKTILWMADEQRAGWLGAQFDETLPPGVKVEFAPAAPAPASQAAIASVRWAFEGTGPAVQVTIRLYTPDTQRRTVTVKAAGKVIAQESIDLKAGAEQLFTIPLKTGTETLREGLSVAMDPDDLAADDTAWLAPRAEAARTVLYSPAAGPGAHFVDHALASLQQFDADALEDKPYPRGDWPAGAVAIATGDCFEPPLLDHLTQFMAAGGAMWIVVDGSNGELKWLADHGVQVTLRPPPDDEPDHLRDWNLDHPILQAFAGQSVLPLTEVGFTRSFGLTGESLTPIANWPDGSVGLAELENGGGRVFISAFPIDRTATDWPVKPSFVPFVHQTLRWLAALQDRKSDWRIGDSIPLDGRSGTWHAIDSARPQPDANITGSVRPAVPGLYVFDDGKTREFFAINTPVGESDLAPWPDTAKLVAFESKEQPKAGMETGYTAAKLSAEAAESQQRLWWWVLAVVTLAILAELAVANRTAA